MLRLAPLDEETWDAALACHDQATLFHTSRWLNLLQRIYDVQVHRLGIFVGDTLHGLFPVLWRQRGPFTLMGSPVGNVATPYLGPLIADELLPETLAAFDQCFRRSRATVAQLRFPHPVPLPALTLPSYRVDPWMTLVIPLQGRTEDDLWKGLKKSCRAHVRQAEKRGVEISEAQNPEIFEDYLRLERTSLIRKGLSPPNPKEFYYALWETLRPAGQMNVFVARYGGKTIGVQINSWYQGKFYALHTAIDSNYRQYYPGNLLEWHQIIWAVRRRLEIYDMVGGPDGGPGEFKLSFGSVPVETPHFICDRSGAITLGRLARQVVRRAITVAGRKIKPTTS
jgi:CelD/BcsL family acetyltransferase involved in cellulose biosynthesis